MRLKRCYTCKGRVSRLFVYALLVSGAHSYGVASGLVTQTALHGMIEFLVPSEFAEMSEEMKRFKYPNRKPPSIIFTDATGAVNLVIEWTSTPVRPDQLTEMLATTEKELQRSYPSAEWFNAELRNINERAFFYLDFRSLAIDTKVRNIMVGTSLSGKLLLISFNVTEKRESKWMPLGLEIISSIEVHDP